MSDPTISKTAASAAAIFDSLVGELDWQKIWQVLTPMKSTGHISCDDAESMMSMLVTHDGDLHLLMQRHPLAQNSSFGESFRCRTWMGGGRYDHVQVAFALLAVAIIADQEHDMTKKRIERTPSPHA